jgi:hypothetical protein
MSLQPGAEAWPDRQATDPSLITGNAVIGEYVSAQSKLRASLIGEQQLELAPTIDAAIFEAFSLYSRESGIDPSVMRQYPGSCAKVGIITQQLLREQGIATKFRQYSPNPGFMHYFLRTDSGSGDQELFVDKTWQQFLSKDAPFNELPDTLIFRASQAAEIAETYNVPEKWQNVWANSVDRTRPWHIDDLALRTIFTTRNWQNDQIN